LYSHLKNEFGKVENLPLSQIPPQFRNTAPDLIYKPYHKLSKPGFVVQIGNRVISITTEGKYCGWDNFTKEIGDIILTLQKSEVVKEFKRLGVRYVNSFSETSLRDLNLTLKIGEDDIIDQPTNFVTVFATDELKAVLRLSNNSRIGEKADEYKIIDIDVETSLEGKDFFQQHEKLILAAHDFEKKVFFGLLSPNFLKTLNPVYA